MQKLYPSATSRAAVSGVTIPSVSKPRAPEGADATAPGSVMLLTLLVGISARRNNRGTLSTFLAFELFGHFLRNEHEAEQDDMLRQAPAQRAKIGSCQSWM